MHDLWYLPWETSLVSGARTSLSLFLKTDDLQLPVTVWRIFLKPEFPLSSKKPLTKNGSCLLPWLSYSLHFRSLQCVYVCRNVLQPCLCWKPLWLPTLLIACVWVNCFQVMEITVYTVHDWWNYKTFSKGRQCGA